MSVWSGVLWRLIWSRARSLFCGHSLMKFHESAWECRILKCKWSKLAWGEVSRVRGAGFPWARDEKGMLSGIYNGRGVATSNGKKTAPFYIFLQEYSVSDSSGQGETIVSLGGSMFPTQWHIIWTVCKLLLTWISFQKKNALNINNSF